jgi:hypothetical protein
VKYRRCSSRLSAGQLSQDGVLSVVSGWGSPQGSLILWRFDTYRSRLPWPVGRTEEKNRVSPFFEIVTQLSTAVVFTGIPRFTGTDQSVNCGMAVAQSVTAWDPAGTDATVQAVNASPTTIATRPVLSLMCDLLPEREPSLSAPKLHRRC